VPGRRTPATGPRPRRLRRRLAGRLRDAGREHQREVGEAVDVAVDLDQVGAVEAGEDAARRLVHRRRPGRRAGEQRAGQQRVEAGVGVLALDAARHAGHELGRRLLAQQALVRVGPRVGELDAGGDRGAGEAERVDDRVDRRVLDAGQPDDRDRAVREPVADQLGRDGGDEVVAVLDGRVLRRDVRAQAVLLPAAGR
jgi:hypothetical protein